MTTEELLAAHQAIIDAWYANWHEQQKRRMDEVFARRQAEATTRQKAGDQ